LKGELIKIKKIMNKKTTKPGKKIDADKLWEVAWTYIRTVIDTGAN
jgi:hypothetical protein